MRRHRFPTLKPLTSTISHAALSHLQTLPQTPALTNYLLRTVRRVCCIPSSDCQSTRFFCWPSMKRLRRSSDKESLDLARRKMEEVARKVNEGQRCAEVIKEVLSSRCLSAFSSAATQRTLGRKASNENLRSTVQRTDDFSEYVYTQHAPVQVSQRRFKEGR